MEQEKIIEALNKIASAICDMAQYQIGVMPMSTLEIIVNDMVSIMNSTYTGDKE